MIRQRSIVGFALSLFIVVFALSSLGIIKTPSLGKWQLPAVGAGLVIVAIVMHFTRGWLAAVLFGAGSFLSLLGGYLPLWFVEQQSPGNASIGLALSLALDVAGIGLLIASVVVAGRRPQDTRRRD